ncbi:MAG TPA: hypothetical protein VIV57_16755 [Anaeromyxobacter sp.]
MARARARLGTAALAVLACLPAEGPLMRPGDDCLSCHDGRGRARRWTVAGTIYDEPSAPGDAGLRGAEVRITDAEGQSFGLRTNRAGNFYTAEPVAFPLTVCVERHGVTSCMEEPVTRGSCNVCHGPQGVLRPENHVRFFPIAAGTKHTTVSCEECHSTFVSPAPAGFRCAACHAAREAALATRHTTDTSDPAIVVGEFTLSSDACLRCHGDAQVSLTAAHPSGFQGAPPHHGALCTICHDAYRLDKPFAGDFATDPRSWPVGSGHGCLHCHPGGPGGG